MSDHERCAGCGGKGKLTSAWPDPGMRIECSKPRLCWWGPECDDKGDAWEQWDRVMRAPREAEELRARVKELENLTADYAEQTADARRMSTKLDRIAEVMDE